MEPANPLLDMEDRLNATMGQLSQVMTALIATQAHNLSLARKIDRLQGMLAKVNADQQAQMNFPLQAESNGADQGLHS